MHVVLVERERRRRVLGHELAREQRRLDGLDVGEQDLEAQVMHPRSARQVDRVPFELVGEAPAGGLELGERRLNIGVEAAAELPEAVRRRARPGTERVQRGIRAFVGPFVRAWKVGPEIGAPVGRVARIELPRRNLLIGAARRGEPVLRACDLKLDGRLPALSRHVGVEAVEGRARGFKVPGACQAFDPALGRAVVNSATL